MFNGFSVNVMAKNSTNRVLPSKNAISWLLISLGITFLLCAFNLQNWVPASFIPFAIWRHLLEKYHLSYPKLWLRLPITIVGALAILATYGSLFGRDASVALMAMMISIKLLETQTKRDFIVMVVLGYFLTINMLLFTQAIWVFITILLATLGLTACLISVSSQRLNSSLTLKSQAQLASKLLLQSIPIMLVLFVLFPRIPGPIWGVPKDSYSGMTGLSDSMEPGNISQLSLSSKVAFRVEFKSNIPDNSQLYWRGPVLWKQDGRRWEMANDKINLPVETLETSGLASDYVITLEPHNRNWLLMLDLPKSLPSDIILKHDMQALSKEPVRTRIRYEGHSYLHYKLGTDLSNQERTLALQLTVGTNPKTRQLATQWVKENKSPEEIIESVLKMFRDQEFIYTLAPPLLGKQPIDDFLFNTKRGFCEYYASSFVYLMRAAGVPARIVTGYQGGELNPNGNYLIIRQSDAHAWAEVWIKDKGWVRVDPTSAVSPNRIEYGIGTALYDSNLLPVLSRMDYPILKKIYLNWDVINNGWNQWVLGYDQEKQLQLLRNLINKDIAWEDIGLILVGTMIAVMILISYLLLRNQAVKLNPVKKTYHQFLKKLAKVGVTKLAHEGAIDFSNRVAKVLPEHATEFQEISQLYSSIQFAKPQSINLVNKKPEYNKLKLNLLKQLVRNLKLK
jgi:transglutaminase-like putative cysteine protease